MTKSIRECIETVTALEVDDKVTFTDETDTKHEGKIVEHQPHRYDNHQDWLVKSTGDTPDSVLELWFDPEGGPTHITVSFENQDRREVSQIETLNN